MLNTINFIRGRDSSVGLVTRLFAGEPGFEFRQGQNIFSFLWNVLPASGIQPSSNGYWGYFPGGTAAWAEPPSGAEVKNKRRHIHLMAWAGKNITIHL